MKTFLLFLGLATLSSAGYAQELPESDGIRPLTSSTAFTSTRGNVVKTLSKMGFLDQLTSPGLGAVSLENENQTASTIKQGSKISNISLGQSDIEYDVIIQPGHYGRTTGKTGAAGALVDERDIVAYIAGRLEKQLTSQKLSVIVVPADNVAARKAKIFLSIHAEGSVNKCKAGPSLAYKAGTSPFAMHTIGLATARALGYPYAGFRADNYTENSTKYYMYNQVNAPLLTGLLEIGEITCPEIERKMIAGADRLAKNLALAITYVNQLK